MFEFMQMKKNTVQLITTRLRILCYAKELNVYNYRAQ